MLADLTRRRLDAKAESRRAVQAGHEAERAWEGMQGSFKVLINSFYGYLGYGGGLFNDYDAAGAASPWPGSASSNKSWRICSSLGQRRSKSTLTASTSCRHHTSATRMQSRHFIDMVAADLPARHPPES